jgi:diadenosine tetraphosphatase ApaH/serine/threonine PP2A family protein phosphatase
VLLGIVSDPHANLAALEAVLDDVQRVAPDELICLGDFVGYGAEPNEVVSALKDRCAVSLAGNHDLAALGAVDISDFNRQAAISAQWTRDQLTTESRSFLESLSPRGSKEGIELAHASLRDPVWEYVVDEGIAAANFDVAPFETLLVGHTHIPAVFRLASTRVEGIAVGPDDPLACVSGRFILNPGGVGQPRDGDPRAAWATWHSIDRVFTLHRVEYPVASAQKAIRAAGLPGMLADRLAEGW